VIDDKPESGEGFESAVAYAVAEKLGFDHDHVKWVRTGFDEAIQPGKKNFDFNLQQYTITPEREKTVSFSEPYYTTNQALVTFANSKFATAKTIADLKSAKLGAATGTTSLAFINDVIEPTSEASVYDTNEDAKAALEANQIDGIVVDLPTSFGIAYGELKDGTVAGQFTREGDEKGDELGMLFDLDNPLVACVNGALDQLKAGGTLKELEDKWLSGSTGAPVISR
jgi:polar amino acid transport system substrate-binding protein